MKLHSRTALGCLAGLLILSGRSFGMVTVAVPSNATQMQRHAADEFSRYASLMTGEQCKVSCNPITLSAGDQVVSIGETTLANLARNTVSIGETPMSAKRKLNVSEFGSEGFLQKSMKLSGADVLFLMGGGDIGTLYSVYDYFERYCNVGYFVDGDYVPKGSLRLTEIDNIQNPQFEYRFWNSDMGHYSHMRGQSVMWQFPEWKKEIDWLVKRKLNCFCYFFQTNLVGKAMADVLGLDRKIEDTYSNGLPSAWTYPDQYREDLTKQIFAYARKFGIKIIYMPSFDLTPEFMKKNPDIKYITDSTYGNPGIHPEDPRAKEVQANWMKTLIKTYGTDHLYLYSPFCEASMGSMSEGLRLKQLASKIMTEAFIEADPDLIWVENTWGFANQAGQWTPENRIKYLDSLPKERMLIYDTGMDIDGWNPYYKTTDYYRGINWAIGILHSGAGDDQIHGNVPVLETRIREVMKDPKARETCKGMFITCENTNQNVLYWHLVTKFAWNPDEVEVDKFLDDYVRTRYGDASYSTMRKATQIMYDAVYTGKNRAHDVIRMTYKDSLSMWPNSGMPGIDDRMTNYKNIYENLGSALKIALAEKKAQNDNPLYESDMVAWARMYLGSKVCYHMFHGFNVFSNKDASALKADADAAIDYMNRLELLLSRRPDYSLGAMFDYVMKVPGTNPFTPKMIRAACTGLNDYNGNDIYETIRFYYKPRLAEYFKVLSDKAAAGNFSYDGNGLNASLFVDAFVNNDLKVPETDRWSGTTMEFISSKVL